MGIDFVKGLKAMRTLISVISLALLFVGCTSEQPTLVDKWASQTHDRVGVIVACTRVDPKSYGGWNGDCPGTDVDGNFIARTLMTKQIPYEFLFNARATAANVIKACKTASSSLRDGGLLFVYFSGHGGQLPGTVDETDGKDETICLYDGQLRDDIVWQLLTSIDPNRNIKVFMVTDCCNSGTNYRKPHDYAKSLSPRVFSARGEVKRVIPNLLHWGGCGDSESSYGSSRGGAFTLAWKEALSRNMTYRQTQSYIKSKLTSQVPTFAVLGQFDIDKPVFEK